jgi:type VI secretion system protein ImpH
VHLLEGEGEARAPVGHHGPVGEETIKFRPLLSLGFPKSDVESVSAETRDDGGRRFVVESTFMGLYGSVSPLPAHFTEELLHEEDDESLVRGLQDLFHHRVISFLYRVWKKYHYHVKFRRGGRDELSADIFCLGGLAEANDRRGTTVPPVRLLRYVGLSNQRPISAAALERVVSDYFDGAETRVQPFASRWVRVPEEARTILGSRNCTLGEDVVAGQEVLDRSSKFRLHLGPMALEPYLGFLPGESGYDQLGELIRVFTLDPLTYDIELRLEAPTVPPLQLAPDAPGARLGQASWLGTPAGDPYVVLPECRPEFAGAGSS